MRAGTAYDATPVPDSTMATRIPDADRYWISAGATYHATEAMDLKLTYSHLFNDTRSVAQNPAQTWQRLPRRAGGHHRVRRQCRSACRAVYRWN